MRILSIARGLFLLLAFQLALGLQVAEAYALTPRDVAKVGAPAVDKASAAHAADCPMHAAEHTNPASTSVPRAAGHPATTQHDCCKTGGCQCHCGTLPLEAGAAPVRPVCAPTLLRITSVARVLTALPDTHFRPPIVS